MDWNASPRIYYMCMARMLVKLVGFAVSLAFCKLAAVSDRLVIKLHRHSNSKRSQVQVQKPARQKRKPEHACITGLSWHPGRTLVSGGRFLQAPCRAKQSQRCCREGLQNAAALISGPESGAATCICCDPPQLPTTRGNCLPHDRGLLRVPAYGQPS